MARRDGRDDEQLLAATTSDADAFATFYARHAHGIFAYFMVRVNRSDLSADLTAEVFAAAFEGARDGRFGSRPVAWLYGIARHKLVDSLRRGQVEATARERLGLPRLALTDAELERTEELIDLEAEAKRFDAMLRDLPAEEREALTARIVDEREYAEIAGRLRCSEAVVRQRVSRGLRRLRMALGEDT